MKPFKTVAILCLAVLGLTICAWADDDDSSGCKNLSGKIGETIIPAPHDPFGRILGTVEGTLNGATSAIITSLTPGANGVLNVTTLDVFITKSGDMLVANGVAVFTPIPGQPPGNFTDSLTLTVVGGTGTFAGVTGTINVSGQGSNLFGGPGVGTFSLEYKGQVCH